jgi:hypothetical protein
LKQDRRGVAKSARRCGMSAGSNGGGKATPEVDVIRSLVPKGYSVCSSLVVLKAAHIMDKTSSTKD